MFLPEKKRRESCLSLLSTPTIWRKRSLDENIRFEGVDQALQVSCTEIRLLGKPRTYERRRMGVALAEGKDVEVARERAK